MRSVCSEVFVVHQVFHLMPGCREETLDITGKVFFIDTVEEID